MYQPGRVQAFQSNGKFQANRNTLVKRQTMPGPFLLLQRAGNISFRAEIRGTAGVIRQFHDVVKMLFLVIARGVEDSQQLWLFLGYGHVAADAPEFPVVRIGLLES